MRAIRPSRAADHGEPLEREGGPGTVSQQVFEAPKIARHIAVDERDPDTGVDGKPAVLPGEHVGGGRGVEQPLHAEPPDHAATDPLGERGQIGRGDRPGRQERRRGVAACSISSRHEHAVGHAGVEVDMMVERRTEAVQKGDAAEPRAGGCGGGGISRDACRSAQQPLDLVKKDLRECGDGSGSVGEHARAIASARRSPTAARAPAG